MNIDTTTKKNSSKRIITTNNHHGGVGGGVGGGDGGDDDEKSPMFIPRSLSFEDEYEHCHTNNNHHQQQQQQYQQKQQKQRRRRRKQSKTPESNSMSNSNSMSVMTPLTTKKKPSKRGRGSEGSIQLKYNRNGNYSNSNSNNGSYYCGHNNNNSYSKNQNRGIDIDANIDINIDSSNSLDDSHMKEFLFQQNHSEEGYDNYDNNDDNDGDDDDDNGDIDDNDDIDLVVYNHNGLDLAVLDSIIDNNITPSPSMNGIHQNQHEHEHEHEHRHHHQHSTTLTDNEHGDGDEDKDEELFGFEQHYRGITNITGNVSGNDNDYEHENQNQMENEYGLLSSHDYSTLLSDNNDDDGDGDDDDDDDDNDDSSSSRSSGNDNNQTADLSLTELMQNLQVDYVKQKWKDHLENTTTRTHSRKSGGNGAIGTSFTATATANANATTGTKGTNDNTNDNDDANTFNLDHLTLEMNTPTATTYEQTTSSEKSVKSLNTTHSSSVRTSSSLSRSPRRRRNRHRDSDRNRNRKKETGRNDNRGIQYGLDARVQVADEGEEDDQVNGKEAFVTKVDAPSSFSDGEINDYFVCTQHLEDVLSKGGEDALEQALQTLANNESLSDPEAFGSLTNRTSANANINTNSNSNSNTSQETRLSNNSASHQRRQPEFLHTSLIANNKSLDEKYLRSHLKSALIALKSVKAERRDVEQNLEMLQQELNENRRLKDEEMYLKDEELERMKREVEKCKEEHTKLEIMSHRAKLEESNASLKLQSELDDTKGKLLLAELDVDSKLERIKELEDRLKQVEIQDSKLETVQTQLSRATSQIDMLGLKLEVKDEQRRKHLDEIKSLKTKLAEAQSVNCEKDSELRKVQKDSKNADVDRMRCNAINQDLSNQIIKYEEELNLEKQRNGDFKVQLKDITNKYNIAEEEIAYHKRKFTLHDNELQDSRAKIKSMETDIMQVRKQVEILKTELDESKGEIIDTETKLQEAVAKAETSEKILHLAQSLEQQHCQTIDNLNTELTSMKNDKDCNVMKIEELEASLQEAANSVTKKGAELEESVQKLQNLETSLQQARDDVQQYQQTIDTLNTELASMKSDKDFDAMKIEELEASLQEAANSTTKKDVKLEENTQEIQNLEMSLQQARNEMEQYQQTINNLENNLATNTTMKESELEESNEKAKILEAELQKHLRTINDLNDELATRVSPEETKKLQDALEERDNDIKLKETKLHEVYEKLNTMDTKTSEYLQIIDDLNTELASTVSEKNNLDEDRTRLEVAREEQNNAFSEKELELEEANERLASLETDLQQAHEIIKDHEDTINDLNDELATRVSPEETKKLQDVLEERDNDIKLKETKLHEVYEKLNTMDVKTSEYLQIIDDLNTELASTVSEKNNLDKDRTKLEAAREEQNNAFSEKELELEEANERLASLETDLQQAHEIIKDHEDTINDLNSQLASKVSAEEIERLQAALQESSKIADMKESKLVEANGKVEILEADIRKHLTIIDDLKSEITSKISNEKKESRNIITEYEAKLEEANKTSKSLDTELQEAQGLIQQHCETIDELQKQLESSAPMESVQKLEASLHEATNSVTEKDSELEERTQKIQNLQVSLQQANEDIVSKELIAQECRKKTKILEAELQKHLRTINDLNDELATRVSPEETKKLQDVLEERDNDIKLKETKLHEVYEKLNTMDAKTSEYLQIIDDLNTELASTVSEKNNLDEDRKKNEAAREEQNNAFSEKELELEEANERLASLETDLQQAHEAINQHLQSINSYDTEIGQLQVALEESINEIIVKEAKLRELNDKVKIMEAQQQKHLAAMDFNTELTTKVSGKKNGLIDKLQSALWESNGSFAEKDAKLQEVTEKLKRFEVDLQNSQEELSQKLEIIDDLNAELASRVSERNEFCKEIETMRGVLRELRSDTADKETNLREAHDKIKNLEEDLCKHLTTIDYLNTELTSRISERNGLLAETIEDQKFDGEAFDNPSEPQEVRKEMKSAGSESLNPTSFVHGFDQDELSDTEDLVRKVVMELVNEIALVKSVREVLCSKCIALEPVKDLIGERSFLNSEISDIDQNSSMPPKQETILSLWKESQTLRSEACNLDQELKIALSKIQIESDRADAVEAMLREKSSEVADMVRAEDRLKNDIEKAKDRLWALITFLIKDRHPSLKGRMNTRDSASLINLIDSLEALLSSKKETQDEEGKYPSPISSQGGNDLHNGGSFDLDELLESDEVGGEGDMDDDNASFVDYLKGQLRQNSVLIRSTLNDIENESHEKSGFDLHKDDEMSMIDLQSVDYHTYECLRRKCDTLEAERDDVLNDTFALLDITKKEHKAEIEAVTNRVKKEAALELSRCKMEAQEKLLKVTEELTGKYEKLQAFRTWHMKTVTP